MHSIRKSRKSTLRLNFEGLQEDCLLAGPSAVLRLLREHFRQWPFAVSEGAGAVSRPLLTIREKGSGFILASSQRRESFSTPAELLCDLGIELAEAFVESRPELQCLHCAAVALPGVEKLVLFPNVNRAGKSLLAASLLMQGARVFADDLLGITADGNGVAFGLPPRLRLPLPPSARSVAGALQSMPGFGDRRYHFLYPGAGLASFGEACALGAMVLPRRTSLAGGPPRLRRLSASAALPCMVYQFQMKEGAAGEVFELACRLCESLPLWLLEYDSPDEAASLIVQEKSRIFAAAEDSEECLRSVDFLSEEDRISEPAHARKREPFPSDRNLRWTLAPGMQVYEKGSFAYLIPKERNSIFGAGGVGLAVLTLLKEPLSLSEAVGFLAEIFPQTGPLQLESDLSAFFRTLYAQGLLVHAPC